MMTSSSSINNAFCEKFSAYDLPLKACGVTIIGIFLRYIARPCSWAFLGYSFSLAATLLVVKLIDKYDISLLTTTKLQIEDFHLRHPKILLIVFVFSVVIGYVSPLLASSCSIFVGCLHGLASRIKQCKYFQRPIL